MPVGRAMGHRAVAGVRSGAKAGQYGDINRGVACAISDETKAITRLFCEKRRIAWLLSVSVSALAAACGGGGGSDTANNAPVLTTPASQSLAENQPFTGQATATDADGDTLTFGLSASADTAQFTIDPISGVVAAIAPFDFEAPLDANGDNLYEVGVTVSDGRTTVSDTFTIQVTDVNEAPAFVANTSPSVAENDRAPIALLAADPEGAPLVYTVTGGPDRDWFTLDPATGDLTPTVRFNHEHPVSSDGDNTYEIDVAVSDGVFDTPASIDVTVVNVEEAMETHGGLALVSPTGSTAPLMSNFGAKTVALGDLDGQGVAELLIVAPTASDGAEALPGAIYLAFGEDLERAPALANSVFAADAVEGLTIVYSGPVSADPAATVSAAPLGDLDGDNIADFAVHFGAAEVLVVVKGSAVLEAFDAGLATLDAADSDATVFSMNVADLSLGTDAFLAAHAVGDYDGDGRHDLVISAPAMLSDVGVAQGSTYILFGDELLNGVGLNDVLRIRGSNTWVQQSSTSAANLGDVDGDGADDLGLGAIALTSNNPDTAYIVPGSVLTAQRSGDREIVLYDDSDFGLAYFIDVADAGAQFGSGLAALGDVNGDGADDFFVGARYLDRTGAELRAGGGFVVFGVPGATPQGPTGNIFGLSNAIRVVGLLADENCGAGRRC